jgi:hypothetical protein
MYVHASEHYSITIPTSQSWTTTKEDIIDAENAECNRPTASTLLPQAQFDGTRLTYVVKWPHKGF